MVLPPPPLPTVKPLTAVPALLPRNSINGEAA
jgi:hypothetical protein